MEKIIAEAMNDTVIQESIKKYGVSFEDVKRLGGFENFIYEYEKDGYEFIIRYVHSHHRSFELVFAELEFIDYLAKNGANVSTVVHTIDDEMLFKVPAQEGHYFSVCVFTKAKGTYVKKENLNADFFEMFGTAVGKLHRLTKSYHPIHKRHHFYEEDFLEMGQRNLGKDHQFVMERAIEIIAKIKGYDQTIDSYGLIHTDLHFGNMYYDGETLTIFDWDDASYKHFISDIAIILFYTFAMGKPVEMDLEDRMIDFLIPFVKGYETENHLDLSWYQKLNDYFMLRQVILFIAIYAAGDDLINSPWGQNFINKFESRIAQNTPLIDIERVVKALWNI